MDYLKTVKLVIGGAIAVSQLACDSGSSDSSDDNDIPYRTGFVLSEIETGTVASGVSSVIQFDIDISSNTMSDNIFANVFPDVTHYRLENVTSIDSQLGEEITLNYNDDGTIARVVQIVCEDDVDYAEYEYEDGKLSVRRVGFVENGLDTTSKTTVYQYSPEGTLVAAQEFLGESTEVSVTYQFVSDADGNIIEVTETDSAGNLNIRRVLSYDEFANVIRMERYGNTGEFIDFENYAYEASSAPAPNLINLFSALNGSTTPSLGFSLVDRASS